MTVSTRKLAVPEGVLAISPSPLPVGACPQAASNKTLLTMMLKRMFLMLTPLRPTGLLSGQDFARELEEKAISTQNLRAVQRVKV